VEGGGSIRETIAEHRKSALRLGFRRFVLQDVPMFGKLAVFEADDIGGDPGTSRPMPEKRPCAMT
jgi:hypothetical protein